MAPSTSVSGPVAALLSAAFLFLLAGPVTARPGVHFHPCNNFLIYSFSSSSSSSSSGDSAVEIPRSPSTVVAVYRVIFPSRVFPRSIDDDSFFRADLARPIRIRRPAALPRPTSAEFGFSSLHDRAKDILVVVVGLLFGVGCGALTAATIYLFWSVLANRPQIYGSDASDEDEEDGVESPKKAGYAKIPSADPTQVKEGYVKN